MTHLTATGQPTVAPGPSQATAKGAASPPWEFSCFKPQMREGFVRIMDGRTGAYATAPECILRDYELREQFFEEFKDFGFRITENARVWRGFRRGNLAYWGS